MEVAKSKYKGWQVLRQKIIYFQTETHGYINEAKNVIICEITRKGSLVGITITSYD